MKAEHLDRQRGNALIFVVTIGLVITTVFALFTGTTVLVEDRAVEAELARSRAYWAEMGNFNYAFSRISYSGFCGTSCGSKVKDSALVPVLQAYFDELSNVKVWKYADESPNYAITATDVAATAGGQNFSGWLMVSSSYTATSLVAASSGKLPTMELRFCGGLNSGGKCGNLGNNNGGNTTRYFSVARLTNLPSP